MSGLTAEPLRAVTEEEVAAFWRDGVVHLTAIIPTTWIESLVEPVDTTIANPAATTDMTDLHRIVTAQEPAQVSKGRFLSGVDHWLHEPAFRAFAATSPLPVIAATLMNAERIHLYEDSVLVKEPETIEVTAFHQDLSYFHLEGERICTVWVPLDPVTNETGAVAYLRGSHKSGLVHQPNWFVVDDPLPGTTGTPIPHVADNDPQLVRFAMEPGDVVVHHAATLHGAGPNKSTTSRRRAVSVRYCGDGVRHLIRPGTPTKAHHHSDHDGIRSGDPVIDHPGCPLVWKRTMRSEQ
ncbi:MAG: phytanoyl-CoA dioxygenase family protein [Acidimicrobiales bacterium]|nr:phytanoyl-CoA dioxygenase family protein [Acidimicrobiales bacterium]